MKETFEYSKRMHHEKTVKPARRKALIEMAVALFFFGILCAGYFFRNNAAFNAFMEEYAWSGVSWISFVAIFIFAIKMLFGKL